jgi:phage host-nuclease inhibitor protein Gam
MFKIETLSTIQKRELIATLRDSIRSDVALKREAKATAKTDKAAARAEKRSARIAALEAKIEALKNPVGAKALKANKKASAVKVYDAAEIAECNAIAANIVAKRKMA